MAFVSVFPPAREFQGWTNYLDRKIIQYLEHTGSLSCACKAGERACLTANAGRLCCPTQRFYHPHDARLLSIFEMEDEEHIKDLIRDNGHMELFATPHGRHMTPPEDTSHRYNYWKWSCCAKNIGCTGCIAVCDAEEDTDVNAAIRANKLTRRERQHESDDDDDEEELCVTPRWDDSIGGDARRGCECGYAG